MAVDKIEDCEDLVIKVVTVVDAVEKTLVGGVVVSSCELVVDNKGTVVKSVEEVVVLLAKEVIVYVEVGAFEDVGIKEA